MVKKFELIEYLEMKLPIIDWQVTYGGFASSVVEGTYKGRTVTVEEKNESYCTSYIIKSMTLDGDVYDRRTAHSCKDLLKSIRKELRIEFDGRNLY